MRVVDRPEMAPHQCAITGASEDPGGFVDTGMRSPFYDPYIYVSREGVRRVAEAFGSFISVEEHDKTLDLLQTVTAEKVELEAKVQELEEFKRSVYVLKAAGLTQQNRPGRKPAKETVSG